MRFFIPEKVPRWMKKNMQTAFPDMPKLVEAIVQDRLVPSAVWQTWRQENSERYHFLIMCAPVTEGNFLALRKLVQLGLDPLVSDPISNQSPFLLAARKGHAEMVRFFLQHGASPNEFALGNISALHYAASSGSLETVKVLIEAGAELDEYDNIYQTSPLGYAVMAADLDMTRLLIDAGSNVEENDFFSVAAQYGSVEIIKYLRESGFNIEYWSPLFQNAFKSGKVDMVKFLTGLHCVENSEDCVVSALKSGSIELLDYILSTEYQEETGQPVKWDPRAEGMVHAALEGGNPKVLRRLLEGGADPNQEFDGKLPLCSLDRIHTVELAKILIEFGADPNLADSQGQTAISFARENGPPRYLRFLEKMVK